MTTIGFIGSGNIGGTVARLAVDAGYDVVVSNSRGPQTLSDLVAELGPRARAATAQEAAEAGEVVVVSVPLKAYEQVPAAPLDGKLVLDTNNYYPQRDGQIAALDARETTTSALLQDHLPGAHVVKVFNNINFKALAVLSRPHDSGDRTTLPIFGDDDAAKRGAEEFLDTIGYDAFDGGTLADSWRSENGTPVYGAPYAEDGDLDRPVPGSHATVVDLLARAEREDAQGA